MTETVQTLNFLVATGGIGIMLLASVLLVDCYGSRAFEKFLRAWGLIGAFLFTTVSSMMTLVYSEVFGFVPCGLCWLQRMFLFPQVALLAVAVYYKDRSVARYGIVLSTLGLVVSLYQHYLQMGGSEFVKCPTSGGDCSKILLFEYGFVTFPLLSAFTFTFLITLYLYILKTRSQ